MVQELSSTDFKKEIVEHKGIALVDFWAPWCEPCKMLAPVIEKLAPRYSAKIKFAKIDIDENSDIASEYGIMSIPCIVFFRDGKEIERMIGFKGEDALRVKLNTLM